MNVIGKLMCIFTVGQFGTNSIFIKCYHNCTFVCITSTCEYAPIIENSIIFSIYISSFVKLKHVLPVLFYW